MCIPLFPLKEIVQLPAHVEAKGMYSPHWKYVPQYEEAIMDSSTVTRSRLVITSWCLCPQICTQSMTQETPVHYAAIENDRQEVSRTDASTEVKRALPCCRLSVSRRLTGMRSS